MSDGLISIEEVLVRSKKQTNEFIKDLKLDEIKENAETIEAIEKEINHCRLNTERIKNKFADEILSGLGSRMMAQPKPIKIKRSAWQRIRKVVFDFFQTF